MSSLGIAGDVEFVAELEANARAFAESIERDELGIFAAFRVAKAESERTGSYAPIAAFVLKLKAGGFRR